MSNAILFLLLVVVTIQQSYSVCKHSYQTTCNSIEDYEKFNDETWTDVVIKSSLKSTVKRVPFRIVKFRNLNSLTLIGLIDGLGDDDNTCVYDVKLKSLNFYANTITSIKNGNFPRFLNLHKLGMVNNGIETLHRNAFALPKIEVIDLSDNKIEKIENGVFTNERSKGWTITKKIIIKNNKLSNIEPHSFPSSLQILKLDYNNLKIISDGVFSDLTYLQGLYLSNNKLSALPNITTLYNLRVLDLSFNNIETVLAINLSNLGNLNVLDLSHNKITSVDFLSSVLVRHGPLEVFLNFNFLHNLNGLEVNATLTEKILNLYGNPWLCDEWPSIENYMESINLKRNKCDMEAFNNNNITFCKTSYLKPREEYVEEFYHFITKGRLLQCEYTQKNYENFFYKKSVDIRCIG